MNFETSTPEPDECVWHVLPGYFCDVYSEQSTSSEVVQTMPGGKLFKVSIIYPEWLAVDIGWVKIRRDDGMIIVAEGDYLIGAFWRFQVICRDGAYVRRGLDLTTEHVCTEPMGSIVESSERRFNSQGLARLRIGSGWASEYLNPLSGQSGQIIQANLID
jgi:hypothetical protein